MMTLKYTYKKSIKDVSLFYITRNQISVIIWLGRMSTRYILGSRVILGRSIILGGGTRIILGGGTRIISNLGWGTHVCVIVVWVSWREVSRTRCVRYLGWGTHVRGMLVHGVGITCRLVRWDGVGHV